MEEDETRASQNLLANCKWFFLLFLLIEGILLQKHANLLDLFSFIFFFAGKDEGVDDCAWLERKIYELPFCKCSVNFHLPEKNDQICTYL